MMTRIEVLFPEFCFRRCTPCRKSPKTAGASQIILKFPLRFLQKALAFLGGIRYA